MKALVTAAFIGLMAAATTQASEVNDPTVGTCTGANCSSIQVDGQVFRSTFNGQVRARPFTIQAFAGPNECLRFETNFQASDLEMTVVSPDGTVHRDDDGSGLCPVCSLIKFVTDPGSRGWYTVHVSHFAGDPVDAQFRFLYGRYTQGNANCAGATPPALTSTSRKAAR